MKSSFTIVVIIASLAAVDETVTKENTKLVSEGDKCGVTSNEQSF